MQFSRFFVDRPIFATVLSVIIVIIGLIACYSLPIAEYPDITPPTIVVSTRYPGANPQVIAETVATPLEQEINGVDNMLYMSSQSTNDGQMSLTITFRLGTDLDEAQVLVQNRVAVALPRLPETVRRLGVVTQKSSPDLLMVVHLLSPDDRYDQAYIGNYGLIQLRDVLTRVEGVGSINQFGLREFSMRVWLDPDKMAGLNLTVGDAIQALSEQNVQVAAGLIGQPPAPTGNVFQLSINTLGRLVQPEQFGDIIIKTGENGRVTRLRDIAQIELGARDYSSNSYLDGKPAMGIAVFQRPGSNALATARAVRQKMVELSQQFPQGLEYRIVYDPTVFVQESVNAVAHTLIEAFILVFIVVLLFLQDWRATLLPMIDVPVSLIGTFGVMAALGFSLNNLSLFGLVLAIGIVVDDAIVVVENIARWMGQGLPPREATIKAMAEITGPVIAITLVLSAVFIPTAFIPGISGQFYRQFALTIAASTIISALNALTMAPARAIQLIRLHTAGHKTEALPRLGIALLCGYLAYQFLTPLLAPLLGLPGGGPSAHVQEAAQAANSLEIWGMRGGIFVLGSVLGWFLSPLVNFLLGGFFRGFNWVFDRVTNVYGRMVAITLRLSVVILVVYGGLLGLTYWGFTNVPTGFIPPQDKGYVIVNIQLPDGASLTRTDEVLRRATALILQTPGVDHAVGLAGFSAATRANSSNAGAIFTILKPFAERAVHGPNALQITQNLRQRLADIQEASLAVFPPPPVRGLGTAGGFKLQIQDRSGAGLAALQAATDQLVAAARSHPSLVGVFTPFRANTPQLYADIDRTKAKMLDVPLNNVFETLQTYLGSTYVNDFNMFGRTYQVTLQAEGAFRNEPDDIARLKTRNASGGMVPLGSLVNVRQVTGPDRVVRYNMFPAADITGDTAPGVSSGQAIAIMEQLANQVLPSGMGYEWTDIAYQQRSTGNVAMFVFPLCVLLVFLLLSALYENWSLPLAVILIVPMCLLCAIAGVSLRGMDNNILTQISFVVLVGLACKNAILIVEFARDAQATGKDRFAAVVEAARLRLRPILMTSFAFILGVVPLVIAKGPGAEMHQALGTSVFSGMLGVTFFGLFLTPVFYVVIRWFAERRQKKETRPALQATHALLVLALLPGLLGLLTGCSAVGPDYHEPAVSTPEHFANQEQPKLSTADVEVAWWYGFHDERLDQLVTQALLRNHDIRIATARLREARALLGESKFDRLPTVTAQGAYTRAQLSRDVVSSSSARNVESFLVGFDASWELDFFGRVRRSIEASTADVGTAEASRRDVIVSLLAELARNYFELRGAQNQLAVARQNADNQQQTLALTMALLNAGRGTELDVSRAEAQLNFTLAIIPSLDTIIQQSSHRLGVLIGQEPTVLVSDLAVPLPLPALPAMVAIGQPADLLRRRPDIRGAERTLAAATARVGVATADLYPRVTVLGGIGLQAGSVVDLFSSGSTTFSIGPNIFWAAFDLGRVRERINAADARTEAALAQYEQRVLLALEETENALVDFHRQQERRGLLATSAHASEKAADLARLRYQAGVADFLTVLDAQRTVLAAQDRLAESETRTATALIAVYKALGGGWEPQG